MDIVTHPLHDIGNAFMIVEQSKIQDSRFKIHDNISNSSSSSSNYMHEHKLKMKVVPKSENKEQTIKFKSVYRFRLHLIEIASVKSTSSATTVAAISGP